MDVAQDIEKKVPQVTAAASAPAAQTSKIRGALTIKQVRRTAEKLLTFPVVSPAPSAGQPPIAVAVKGQGVPVASKWEAVIEQARKQPFTRGHMMVDTGAAMTLLTEEWVKAHGLKITEG